MSLNTVDVFQQAKIRLILLPFNGIFLRFTHNVLGRHICIAHLFGLLTPFYKKQYNFVRLSAFIFSRFSSQPYFVQCSNFLPLEAPENEIYFATFREYKIRALTQNGLNMLLILCYLHWLIYSINLINCYSLLWCWDTDY